MPETTKIDRLADRRRLARMKDEHSAQESRIRDLHVRAYGEWDDLDEVWSDFARALESHMAFEEHELFNRFLMEHPEQADYVAQLWIEHGEIRRAVEKLGIEVQLHVVRADTVNALLDLLSHHAASEQQAFYPWLETKLP